jgi:hypothetical protein
MNTTKIRGLLFLCVVIIGHAVSQSSVSFEVATPPSNYSSRGGVADPSSSARQTVERINEWIAQNVTALPESRAQILAIPIEYRLTVYERLPSSTKAAIWQDKVTQVLRSRDWTLEQTSILLDLLSVATDATFINTPESKADFRAWTLDWNARAKSVLTASDIRRIVKSFEDFSKDSITKPADNTNNRFLTPFCNCRDDRDECGGGFAIDDCPGGGCMTITQCGVFYTETCDGYSQDCT